MELAQEIAALTEKVDALAYQNQELRTENAVLAAKVDALSAAQDEAATSSANLRALSEPTAPKPAPTRPTFKVGKKSFRFRMAQFYLGSELVLAEDLVKDAARLEAALREYPQLAEEVTD